MHLTVLTVSSQSSEIIADHSITLNQLSIPNLNELYEKIHEIYPTMYPVENFTLVWQYNDKDFLEIYDFLSYLTALTLMANKSIYLILHDCDEHCEENEDFLKRLDEMEAVDEREKRRSKYDVTIPVKGDMDDEIRRIVEEVFKENIFDPDLQPRTPTEILNFALRKSPPLPCHTADLIFKTKLIADIKKGWPKLKLKKKLVPMEEEVIQRAAPKGKGKGKGKDKGKKDKGKGKKKK